jgi:hypothetical protein
MITTICKVMEKICFSVYSTYEQKTEYSKVLLITSEFPRFGESQDNLVLVLLRLRIEIKNISWQKDSFVFSCWEYTLYLFRTHSDRFLVTTNVIFFGGYSHIIWPWKRALISIPSLYIKCDSLMRTHCYSILLFQFLS